MAFRTCVVRTGSWIFTDRIPAAWDQRAYWATVVTINIAKLTPAAGEFVAGVLRGGASIGALTLTRWYAVHVIFLPAALVGLIVLHMTLMRRHGISGPVRARQGAPMPFYPFQAARHRCGQHRAGGARCLCLAGPPRSRPRPIRPTRRSFPRPEWYFLGLFQLLKYFPASGK